jgi:hypothetical protein
MISVLRFAIIDPNLGNGFPALRVNGQRRIRISVDGRKRTNGEKRRLGDAYRNCSKSISPMARAGALRLPDELFDQSYRVPKPEETVRYLINEFEPAFDAADFSRCGRDLFVIPEQCDERGQDRWLRRHVGDRGLRMHEVESRCSRRMYIDTLLCHWRRARCRETWCWKPPSRRFSAR